ncbi:preprotein translocase subunit SecY [Oenococcus sicerae]|uniref:Protein translocase subunit SecY n=1 Tax=Oenococcus sicerae TaxID=2203724 RepID=A0AAJ1VP93_9LACO|nr:preprotein translocase subunit SecY [Oenococcus sicerae]MDN6901024.1 preprotein translocase subunit SecY [Oenococcus sicerae]QAS70059.1 preprotein translocase subunit SecY [Oenococcus sicerae]
MFNLLSKALKQKEIRVRIYWTLLILFVYRFGAYITVPGVNASALTKLMNQTSLLSILNLFSGGGLSAYSLFALGVSPYVTAQIVIQLLQMDIVPKLVEWSKQGETGRRKTTQITRYLTIVLAFIQSIGITAGLNALGQPIGVTLLKDTSINSYLIIATVMTVGSMLSVWLGEQIQDKGIGNGVSMIIFAGIVAQLIPGLWQIFQQDVLQGPGLNGWISFGVLALALIIIVTGVTWFYGAVRRLPMQYTRSDRNYGDESYLPLRVNVSGVIPVIFASSLITTPQTILQAFVGSWGNKPWYTVASDIFSLQTWEGTLAYGTLIVLFTFFYAFVQVNPEKVSENLQKQGSYIIGVRPGEETKKFLSQLLNRLSGPGSIFLAAVAVVPLLAQNFGFIDANSKIGLGGTSLLIVIGVAVDLMRQIEGLTQKKNYIGLIHSHPFYDEEINKGEV